MHYRIATGTVGRSGLIMVLLFSLWGHPPCWSDTGDDVVWTFRFDKTPIAEVLNELSETTNVEIFTNRPPEERMLTKTYTNMNLARIIRDIFKGVSFALVWYYSETGLDGIGVWFFDSDQGAYPGRLRSIEDRMERQVDRPPFQRSPMSRSFQEEDQPPEEEADYDTQGEVAEEETSWESEPGELESQDEDVESATDAEAGGEEL